MNETYVIHESNGHSFFQWIDKYTTDEKFDVISSLKANWDLQMAKSISKKAIKYSKELLNIADCYNDASVFPGKNESVDIEIGYDNYFIAIEVFKDLTMKVLISVTDDEKDESFEETKKLSSIDMGSVKWFIKSMKNRDTASLIGLWNTY